MNLPAGYITSISGRAREFEKTFVEFLWVFLLAVIFMYMILASQFESLVHPLNILLSLPLAVPFALFSLWYTGNTLNLYSALGILVLFGVVKKNAILQVDHMNALRHEGHDLRTAVLQGNRDRLRPILMTTLALVGGMLPLWVGTGPGSEERRAIAVVVIGGQTLSLLLTLLVTPVAYLLLHDLVRMLSRRRRRPRLPSRSRPAATGLCPPRPSSATGPPRTRRPSDRTARCQATAWARRPRRAAWRRARPRSARPRLQPPALGCTPGAYPAAIARTVERGVITSALWRVVGFPGLP